MLTYPGFNHKTGSVSPSLTSLQLKCKPRPLGLLLNTDKCVYEHLCVSSGRKTEKSVGVGGKEGWEGVRACLAQHFFAHSPDKGLSVLLASHSGRRPHDSPVPISRVTPQLQQPEKLQSLALFVYFCLYAWDTINPLVSDYSMSGAMLPTRKDSNVCFGDSMCINVICIYMLHPSATHTRFSCVTVSNLQSCQYAL